MRDVNRVKVAGITASLLLCGVFSGSPLVTASVWGQAQSQSAFRADADIQTDLAAAIGQSQQLQGQSITAAVIQGNVTLSGTVRDEAAKHLAEQIASRVNGVRSVENNLAVNAAAAQPAPVGPAQDSDQPPPPPPYDQGVSQPDVADNQQQQGYPPPSDSQQPQRPYYPPAQNYPQQGYPQQSYPQQNYPQPQLATGPVTIPAGTLLNIRTSEVLDSRKAQAGTFFQATVANPVYQGNVLAIPRGAVLTGQITGVRKPGDLAGKSGLQIQVTSLSLGGQTYPLTTDTWTGEGPSKGGYSAANTVGGAGTGALIGAIAGGGPGAAIGAVAGGVVGLAASAGTKGPRIIIPAEAVLSVHLTAPVTVNPISYQEVQRLEQSAPQQPRLVRRPVYVYGYPYPYPYAYYPYRPYYYPRY